MNVNTQVCVCACICALEAIKLIVPCSCNHNKKAA